MKQKKQSTVPPSIKLLFKNDSLDIIKTICLLYSFYLMNKKKFNKVSDIVFYFSLVNFNLVKLFEKDENNKKVSPNLYFRFQAKINQIVLELSHLKFIEIKGDLTNKTNDLGVKLTSEGVDFLMELDKEFFIKLTDEYISVINKVESTSTTHKIIRGGV